MDPSTLGKRIKKVRNAQRLTLKAIEAEAGISATHISEIERGKTSPTLGALLRLAAALGKDASFFLEEEELADVSVVSAENRVSESLSGAAGTFERLTMSVPGAALDAQNLRLKPGGTCRFDAGASDGETVAIVLAGSVRIEVDGRRYDLGEGDAIHFEGAHKVANTGGSDAAEILRFTVSRWR